MAYEQKINFALFVNKGKRHDKQPDYTGVIEFPAEVLAQLKPGVKYDVAAWQKTSKNGNEYVFGLVGEEEGAWQQRMNTGVGYVQPEKREPQQQYVATTVPGDVDEDIPF
jgi:hypothetical protein